METESKIWIPEDKRYLGAVWTNMYDKSGDALCWFENYLTMVDDGVCCDCGEPALLLTECIFSMKTAVSQFCEDRGMEDVSFDMSGDRQGDTTCTCLACGNCESGSPPFGMIFKKED